MRFRYFALLLASLFQLALLIGCDSKSVDNGETDSGEVIDTEEVYRKIAVAYLEFAFPLKPISVPNETPVNLRLEHKFHLGLVKCEAKIKAVLDLPGRLPQDASRRVIAILSEIETLKKRCYPELPPNIDRNSESVSDLSELLVSLHERAKEIPNYGAYKSDYVEWLTSQRN